MISIKKDFVCRVFIYILLFFIGLNFKTNAVLFCYVLAVFVVCYGGIGFSVPKVLMPANFMAFFILLSLIINNKDISLSIILKTGLYPLMLFIFYQIGKKFLRDSKNLTECICIFFVMFFAFSFGNVIHIMLDLAVTNIDNVNIGRRIINDIWTGGTAVATIVAGWGCITPSIVIYAFEKRRERKILFIVSLLSLSVCLIFSLIFATRVILVNYLFIVILFLILLIIQKEKVIRASDLIRILFGIFIIVFVIYNMMPYIFSSNLFTRLSGDSMSFLNTNGRIDATVYLLRHFTESIWGGEYFTRQYGLQQHNILFQMYDLYGLVPFVFLGIVIVNGIKCTINIAKSVFISNPEKRFVILLFISLMLYYFEEPALTSNYIITLVLFAYIGFVQAIQKKL